MKLGRQRWERKKTRRKLAGAGRIKMNEWKVKTRKRYFQRWKPETGITKATDSGRDANDDNFFGKVKNRHID